MLRHGNGDARPALDDLPAHSASGAIRVEGRVVRRLRLKEAQRTLVLAVVVQARQ